MALELWAQAVGSGVRGGPGVRSAVVAARKVFSLNCSFSYLFRCGQFGYIVPAGPAKSISTRCAVSLDLRLPLRFFFLRLFAIFACCGFFYFRSIFFQIYFCNCQRVPALFNAAASQVADACSRYVSSRSRFDKRLPGRPQPGRPQPDRPLSLGDSFTSSISCES